MSIRSYRLTLLLCVLTWFLTGMHTPIVHAWTHHGHAPSVAVSIAASALALIAVAALVVLLRAPMNRRGEAGPSAS